jgi:hypothetical protein
MPEKKPMWSIGCPKMVLIARCLGVILAMYHFSFR